VHSKAIYLKAARIIALFALDRAKNPRGDSLPKGDKCSKSDIVNPPPGLSMEEMLNYQNSETIAI